MELTLIAVVTLVIGLALGWFFGSRPLAAMGAQVDSREREAKDAEEKFRRAIVDLASESERAKRADELARTLDIARTEHARALDRLRTDHATARSEEHTSELQSLM